MTSGRGVVRILILTNPRVVPPRRHAGEPARIGANRFSALVRGEGGVYLSTQAKPGDGRDGSAVLTLKQCQNLLRQRLTRPLRGVLHELTGLHLDVSWLETVAGSKPGKFNEPCPRARQCREGKLPERCETCLEKRWQHLWKGQKAEKCFAGLCGSINYCGRLNVSDLRPVTLLVQQRAPASPADRQAFIHAVSLTRLIIHELQATFEAGQSSHESGSASIRGAGSPGILPGNGTDARAVAKARSQEGWAPRDLQPRRSHNQRIVQRMLDYIHEHYSHPMQLSHLAAALSMNASYVSSLFSTTTGVTFHHYLEQFRLARAKNLLRDPLKRVKEVASAVGYPNPDHFRKVFRTHVGIPPSEWREPFASASLG